MLGDRPTLYSLFSTLRSFPAMFEVRTIAQAPHDPPGGREGTIQFRREFAHRGNVSRALDVDGNPFPQLFVFAGR